MRKLAFAVLAAMMLGACATEGNGNGNDASGAQVVAGTAQYCWADRLEAIGTRYNCNWAASILLVFATRISSPLPGLPPLML